MTAGCRAAQAYKPRQSCRIFFLVRRNEAGKHLARIQVNSGCNTCGCSRNMHVAAQINTAQPGVPLWTPVIHQHFVSPGNYKV